jgi:ATP-dependent DNA ligase
MLWRVSRPIRTRSKPPGFILPCQPALADRPPAGPGWLHEIKFDGYRVIARKDGERVRLWARTTSDCSSAFTGIRNAVAALPVDSFVLDGEASPVERKLSFQGGYVEKLDRILSEAYWPEHRLRAPQAATKS